MITDERRAELRVAALRTWRTMHRDLFDRAASAQEESAHAIIRAEAAIHHALQAMDRRAVLAARRVRPVHVVVAEVRAARRVLLCEALRADGRTEVAAAAVDGPQALGATIVAQPDIAVLDDHLGSLRGRDVAVQLRLYAPQTATIVMVDPRDPLFTARPSAVDAIYPRDGDRRALVDLIARMAA